LPPVPEGRSDRSLARNAWDSTTAQKSRPVGYGLIRAGMRTDSIIWSDQRSSKNTEHLSTRNTSGIRSAPDHIQALRAKLRSDRPFGNNPFLSGIKPPKHFLSSRHSTLG
jgi:hypothetical protein